MMDEEAHVEGEFSEYYEGTLTRERSQEVASHLGKCERCNAEYERFRETLGALSGLHKLSAPPDFEEQVADTINRRSAGKFFGRKAFGDRIPILLLAIIAILVGVGVVALVRSSPTGSLHERLEKPSSHPR